MPFDIEELKKQFGILAKGNPTDIRLAKKVIEKGWKNNYKFFESAESTKLILDIVGSFDSVKNPINQTAIISGMSLPFLSLTDDNFVPLKDFIIKNLQHEAARKTGDWLYCSFASRAEPLVYPEGKELTDKQKKEKEISSGQYLDLINELETLVGKYDDGTETCEYIDDMKQTIPQNISVGIEFVTFDPQEETLRGTR